ncbi:MAG: hypothetical protein O3C40_15790 [Planctomycetota bacterium]|nr:hypothetical protein [Planctomycetota bacterium]
MIYQRPPTDAPVDQGDIIEGCPVLRVTRFDVQQPDSPDIECAPSRVVVLSQTCDLANQKATLAVVAVALEAEQLVAIELLKVADIRGPIRAGRVFGWYFLPRHETLGLPELIVDLRQLHTVPIDVLTALCRQERRLARVEPLYREHLSKHFADTYSRIGLPEPYETE